ncbi:membrane-anchored protein [Phyllobacterium lublinensis]|uniref:membrane-anchored protein n=1 Tax=Phyllobacterium lublinensis TaxID=2875708 RepID=UPI001CC971D3|nr:membrane-anchored protein [Phyllobacterium sp. 2063]MBZ9654685.1 membrane-anchored protein [Phyllobacterium sp. 2063]
MGSSWSERLTRIRRSLVYKILRPRPPSHPVKFTGPVVVVGSAPVSTVPAGFGDRFHVITVNGSQTVLDKWGIEVPDATFMQFNQVEGQTTNALHVRKVLNGKRTGLLYVVRWPKSLESLEKGLAAFNYAYDDVKMVNRLKRMAMYEAVMGGLNVEIDDDMKFSNGITAVFYAIVSGAKAVIISGINPDSSGHVYNDANLKRLHAGTDKQILQALIDRGYPIYTADPNVARASGVPLWKKEALDDFV